MSKLTVKIEVEDKVTERRKMTKEELKKEAEEWLKENSKEFILNPKYSPFDYAEAIYLAGAESREEHIAEPEAQIEKMKFDVKGNIKWADENKNNQMYFKLNTMFNQWKIKEND